VEHVSLMEPQVSINPQNCVIEFRVTDEQRFQIFLRFFESLRTQTQSRSPMQANSIADTIANAATLKAKSYDSPEEWMLTFRPQDLAYLKLPPHRDAIQALKRWQGLTRKERRTDIKENGSGDPALQTLAEFVDMLKHFQHIEYELVRCEKTSSDSARIDYTAYSYRFRGKVALEEMLLFFGFFSIINDSC
jgi:hypothetical protein